MRVARVVGVTVPKLPAAVLWDMDGTLIDSEPFWFEAETTLVERFGGTWTTEQARALVGSGLHDGARVLQDHGVAMPLDDIVHWQSDHVTGRLRQEIPWRPGALALLAAVRDAGVPTALVTMSQRTMAEAVVAAMPFGAFDVVVAGDDVTRPKPHPEAYLRAAELLGVPIEDCVAVEDSPPGLASAVGSGAATVGVPHHASLPEGDAWALWTTLEGRGLEDLAQAAADLRRTAA